MRTDHQPKAKQSRRLHEAARVSESRRAKLRRRRRPRVEIESTHHAAESPRG